MLCDQIRIARQARGMTQAALAQRLHVVRQTVSKWEKGNSVPDAEQLPRLAAALEVPVHQLLELEDTSAQLEARLEAIQADQARRVQFQKKREGILFLSFLSLVLALAGAQSLWGIAAFFACALAATAVLCRNLELLTQAAPRSAGHRAVVQTTVFCVVLEAALVALVILEKQGLVALTDQGDELVVSGVMVLLVLWIGLAAPKLPFNRFVGLRLPWTVRDADTWVLAHRILGWIAVPVLLFYLAGVLVFPNFGAVFLAAMAALIGIPGVISGWFFWRKFHPKR